MRLISPVDFNRRYHLIAGKASERADAMLAEYRMNIGGDYDLVANTPDECEIHFKEPDGRVVVSKLTKLQVLLSRWPWQKNDGGWRNRTAKVREIIQSGKTADEVWLAMLPFYKDNYGTGLSIRRFFYLAWKIRFVAFFAGTSKDGGPRRQCKSHSSPGVPRNITRSPSKKTDDSTLPLVYSRPILGRNRLGRDRSKLNRGDAPQTAAPRQRAARAKSAQGPR